VTRAGDETGGAAVELVLATPFIVMLMLFVLFGGRLTVATADVNAAARASARAASLARSPAAAATAAEDTARRELEAEGVPCDSVQIETDTGSFAPGGSVSVVLRCELPLRDLGLLGLPSSRTVEARQVAVVDRYRGIG
jgi:hypothetical protein